jgi:hypothetical protein
VSNATEVGIFVAVSLAVIVFASNCRRPLMLNAARGTYTVSGLMPAIEDKQLEYRIRHFSEDFERVALESELTARESEHGHR